MLKDKTTEELVARVVEIATGEAWGDGLVVTDVIHGYASPRYGSTDAVVVLGDWNTRDKYDPTRTEPLTKWETMPARLARVLERVGAEVEWLDEWTSCAECYRAIRTEPDSYWWKPEYAWIDDGPVCARCLLADVASAVDGGDYANNADNAITWCGGIDLARAGWTQWEAHHPRTYEAGWFDGQTDDPHKVLAGIRRETDADVVFLLDESSQFYIKFSAWTRDSDSDDSDDSDS